METSSDRGPPAGRSHQALRFASQWKPAGLQSSHEYTGASPRGETASHSTEPVEKRESVFSIGNRSQLKHFDKRDQCFSFTAVAIEQLNLGSLVISVGEFSILRSSL